MTLKDAQTRKAALTAKLEHLDGLSLAPQIDRDALRETIAGRLAERSDYLLKEPSLARQIIAKLLAGRISTDGQTFTGTASYGRVLSGMIETGGKGVSRSSEPPPGIGCAGKAGARTETIETTSMRSLR